MRSKGRPFSQARPFTELRIEESLKKIPKKINAGYNPKTKKMTFSQNAKAISFQQALIFFLEEVRMLPETADTFFYVEEGTVRKWAAGDPAPLENHFHLGHFITHCLGFVEFQNYNYNPKKSGYKGSRRDVNFGQNRDKLKGN